MTDIRDKLTFKMFEQTELTKLSKFVHCIHFVDNFEMYALDNGDDLYGND